MSAGVRWVADRRGDQRSAGSPASGLLGLLTMVLLTAVVAGIAMVRGGLLLARPTGLTAGAENATPAELTATAADVLEGAVASGCGGYTFAIVQSAAIVAREGRGHFLARTEAGDLVSLAKGRHRRGFTIRRCMAGGISSRQRTVAE